MEDITLILTVASIIVPVCATIIMSVYTVEKRVQAEHKPYIVLDSITQLSKLEKCFYFIVLLGKKIKKKYTDKELEEFINSDKNINVKITLRNIGYGVATNISFYNLETGTKIYGNQIVNDNLDQRLFTTFDIASNESKSVQTALVIKENEDKIMEDTINTLCIYQDLNGNVYNFVFTINIKSGGGYNYYAYQPSSHSYTKIMKKYKKQKRIIIQDYNK